LHAGAWLAWLTAASATAFLTSNPLYVSLGLLAVSGVWLAAPDSPKKRMMWPVVLIGLFFSLTSIPLNVLTGSSGSTELISVPELRFPGWIGGVPFGGSITGEALVAATARAITISTLVVAAAAFNGAIDHFRLVRLAPRSLAHAMLVLTIAILVVPQAIEHWRRVAEARRLRGREGRGLRAIPALLLPVLEGALERSVQRAESLEARGFGAGVRTADWRLSIVGVAGVGLCVWGAFAQFYYGGGFAPMALLIFGAGLVALAVVRTGGTKPDRLRIDRTSARDAFVMCAAALSVVLVLALRVAGAGDVSYLAYPKLTAPAFHPIGALAFVLLIAPALVIGGKNDA
jgi:energy-coupling factor transport system permease protein